MTESQTYIQKSTNQSKQGMIDQHRQAISNNHTIDVSDQQDYHPCILQRFLAFQTSLPVRTFSRSCVRRGRGGGGGGRDSRSPPRSGCLRGDPLEMGGVVFECCLFPVWGE